MDIHSCSCSRGPSDTTMQKNVGTWAVTQEQKQETCSRPLRECLRMAVFSSEYTSLTAFIAVCHESHALLNSRINFMIRMDKPASLRAPPRSTYMLSDTSGCSSALHDTKRDWCEAGRFSKNPVSELSGTRHEYLLHRVKVSRRRSAPR